MKEEILKKVTKIGKMKIKSSARGEKCLSKFTSSNGSVYGSLTLDIRKAGDYVQELPVAVRVCYEGQKVFLRLGKKYTMANWLDLCDYEKTGRRVQLNERNELKELMDRVEQMTNQLIAEGNFSIRRLQDKFQGKMDYDTTIYSIWEDYLQTKSEEGKASSVRCNKDVKSRFIKDMGSEVAFSDIDRDFLLKWVKAMKQGGLNITTIAIEPP
jgi:hypothetical protein